MMKFKNWLPGILLSLATTQLVAAPIVYFDFDGDGLQDTTTSVALGSALTAGLYVSNVDNLNGGLISWGAEIDFTNSFLSSTSYNIAPTWPLPGVNNNINNSTGAIELLASSFSAQTGTIKLADIFFDTLTSGSTSLNLTELFSNNTSFSAFTAADGFDYDAGIDFSLATSTINISAVPVPPSLILFISGLIGLSSFKKIKNLTK
jgi:hypothetical protein